MTNPLDATTTIIHRPGGELRGYRMVYDRAARVAVHDFPMADLSPVAAAGLLGGACAYVLTDGKTAYFGESEHTARRISDHAADPAKPFARRAFVVAGCDGSPFGKLLALDFQYRMTVQAVEAGVVEVIKGANPVKPRLASADIATHDRIYDDTLRLLEDAGCNIFRPPPVAEAGAEPMPAEPAALGEGEDAAADSGPMAIGVPTGGQEFELRYCGLWARGYPSGGRFIVAAGSEVRTQTNGSVDHVTRKRREELFRAKVLEEIPGAADRRRLTVAVAFATQSIAAKVTCGAHSAGRWPPLAARAVVLEP
jgi:hypothetical protein